MERCTLVDSDDPISGATDRVAVGSVVPVEHGLYGRRRLGERRERH
jgi:hypothetical protein